MGQSSELPGPPPTLIECKLKKSVDSVSKYNEVA